MKIGVLGLQGDYAAHARHLKRCGVEEIRTVTLPHHLTGLQGLIIPGGESTSLLKLMAPHDFLTAIKQFIQNGGGLLATCAGMILAARHVIPEQPSLHVIDIEVLRNAYGRQRDSHITQGQLSPLYFKNEAIEMVFIRAPQIQTIGPDVRVLASVEGQPVMVQHDKVIVLAFHPELTDDLRIHTYFLQTLDRGCLQFTQRGYSNFGMT
jgi:5'-phosphate synthase pdxT subunit